MRRPRGLQIRIVQALGSQDLALAAEGIADHFVPVVLVDVRELYCHFKVAMRVGKIQHLANTQGSAKGHEVEPRKDGKLKGHFKHRSNLKERFGYEIKTGSADVDARSLEVACLSLGVLQKFDNLVELAVEADKHLNQERFKSCGRLLSQIFLNLPGPVRGQQRASFTTLTGPAGEFIAPAFILLWIQNPETNAERVFNTDIASLLD